MNSPMNPAQNIHRVPPHSEEAEKGVLGSMMLSPREGIAQALERIDRDYFYLPVHQTIFEELVDLWRKDRGIDLITFTQAMRDRKLIDMVGGPAFITDLYTFVPTAANLPYYLDIVRDKYIRRRIIATETEAVRRAYDDQDETESVLQDYQSNAIEIGQLAQDDETSRTLAGFVPEAMKTIQLTYKQRGHCSGISTGFVDLDRMMNGFEAPLTYYFAARPAMGKSSLMLAFAYNIGIAAAAQKRRIKIFSVEMTGQNLAKRLIASRADVELTDLRFGFLSREKLERCRSAANDLMTDYIRIDEKGDLSIFEFRARARMAVIKDKCELIMIDYLQRMKGSSKRAQMSRELEISEIAQGISATAKELNVPIVVLAQLNRNPEERKDGKPELGDLRESGSLEQEARFVGLLWRPTYYANNPDKRDWLKEKLKIQEDRAFDEYAECIVAKQNEGPTGPVSLRFVPEFARYEPEDSNRPLFSTQSAKRQTKTDEFLASIKEVFPNATVIENGD
jgi:replicative DNA helicase